MEILADVLLCLLALIIIMSMVALITGLFIAALKVILPLGVFILGCWMLVWSENNLKWFRAQR